MTLQTSAKEGGTQLDFPGAASTDGNGINAVGVIVDDYFDHPPWNTAISRCTKKQLAISNSADVSLHQG